MTGTIILPRFSVEATAIRGDDPHLVVKIATNGLALAWRVDVANTMRGICNDMSRIWREDVPEITREEIAGLEAVLAVELRKIWKDDWCHVRVRADHDDIIHGLALTAIARQLGL